LCNILRCPVTSSLLGYTRQPSAKFQKAVIFNSVFVSHLLSSRLPGFNKYLLLLSSLLLLLWNVRISTKLCREKTNVFIRRITCINFGCIFLFAVLNSVKFISLYRVIAFNELLCYYGTSRNTWGWVKLLFNTYKYNASGLCLTSNKIRVISTCFLVVTEE
jgi:hypothetical protein